MELRDLFASRTKSDRVLPLFPRVTDNTSYLTLHNITYSLILNFVPTAPVCTHVASLPIVSRRSERGTPPHGNEKVSPQSMPEP